MLGSADVGSGSRGADQHGWGAIPSFKNSRMVVASRPLMKLLFNVLPACWACFFVSPHSLTQPSLPLVQLPRPARVLVLVNRAVCAPPLLESLSFPCTPRTLVGLPITTLASTAAPFIPTNFARTQPEKTCKIRRPALSLPPLSVSLPQTSLLHLARTASRLQTRYRVSAAPARWHFALVDLPGLPSLTDTAETLRSHTSVNAFRHSTPA
jgi:hypothetical protein